MFQVLLFKQLHKIENYSIQNQFKLNKFDLIKLKNNKHIDSIRTMRKQKSPIRTKVLNSLTRAFSGKKQEESRLQDVVKEKKQLTKVNKEEYQHSIKRSVDQVLGFSQAPTRSYRLNRTKQTQQKKTSSEKIIEVKKIQEKIQETNQMMIQSRSFVKDKRLTVGDSRPILDQKSQISQTSRAKTSKAEQNASLFNLTQSQREISTKELDNFKQQNKELTMMKLSQQVRQALKKIQIYDKFSYGTQSINICGQVLANQVKRLQKIKISQKQLRMKYYDSELAITALHYNVKFMAQIMKKQKQLGEANRILKQKNQIYQKQKAQQQIHLKKSYKKQQNLVKQQQVSNPFVEESKKKLEKLQKQAKQNQILLNQKQLQLQKYTKLSNDKDQQLQTVKHSLARLKQEHQKRQKQLKQTTNLKKQLVTAQNQIKSFQVQLTTLREFKTQTQKNQSEISQGNSQKDGKIMLLNKELQKLKQFQTTCVNFIDSFTQKLFLNNDQNIKNLSLSSQKNRENLQNKSASQNKLKSNYIQKKGQTKISEIESKVTNSLQQQQKTLRINFPQEKLLRELLQPFTKPPLSKNQDYKCITKMMNSFIVFIETSKSTQKKIISHYQATVRSLQKQISQIRSKLQKQENLLKREQERLLTQAKKQNQKLLFETKKQVEQSSSQLKKEHEKIQKLYQKTSQQNVKLKQTFSDTLTQLQQNIAKAQKLQKTQHQLNELYAKLQKQYQEREKHVSKIKSLQQQLASFRNIKKEHQKQLQKLNEQVRKKQNQRETIIKTTEKQLNVLKQEKQSHENKINQLSDQLEKYRIHSQQAQSRSHKLNSEIRQLNNKIKILEGSTQKVTKQKEKVLQQKEKTIERRQQQITTLTKLKEENNHQLQKMAITIRSKSQEILTMTNTINQLQSKLNHIQKKYEQLQKTSSQSSQQTLELTLINKQQQNHLKQLKKSNQSHQLSKLNLSKQIEKFKQRQLKAKEKITEFQVNQKVQVNKYLNLQKELKQKEKQLIELRLLSQKNIQKLKSEKEDLIIKKQLLEESYKKLEFMIKEEKIQTLSSKDQLSETKTKIFIQELQTRNLTYIQKMHSIQLKYQQQNRQVSQKYETQLKLFYELKNQKHHLEHINSQLSKKLQNSKQQSKVYESQQQLLKNIIFYIRNTPKSVLQLDQFLIQLNLELQNTSQKYPNKMYYIKQLIEQVYHLQKKSIEYSQKNSEGLRTIRNIQSQIHVYKQCLSLINQARKLLTQDLNSSLSLPLPGAQISYTFSFEPHFIHSLENLINVHRHSTNNNQSLTHTIELLHGLWNAIKQSSRLYSQNLKQFDSHIKSILIQNKQKVHKLEYRLRTQEQSHNHDLLAKINQKQKCWQEKMFLEAQQYESKINSMKVQINQLKVQTTNLHQTIKLHSTDTDNIKYKIQFDSQQVSKLRQQLQSIYLQKNSIENQLRKNEKTIQTQKRQIKSFEQFISGLEDKNSRQKEIQMKLQFSQRFYKQTNQELNSQLKTKINQINRLLLSKQSMLRDHSYQLQSISQTLTRKIHELQVINSLNSLKINNFQEQLDKLLTLNSNLQSKIQQVQYNNEKLRQKLEQQVSNYDQLYSKFNILINEYDQLNQQLQQFKIKTQNHIQSLESEASQLFNELQHTKQKKDELSHQNKRLNGNIYILNHQIKEVMEIFRKQEINHYTHAQECMMKDKTEIQILKLLYTEIDNLIKENEALKLKMKSTKTTYYHSDSMNSQKVSSFFEKLNQLICKISENLKNKLLTDNNNESRQKKQAIELILKKHRQGNNSSSFNNTYNLLNPQRFLTVLQDSIIQLFSIAFSLPNHFLTSEDMTNIQNKTLHRQNKNFEISQKNKDKQNLKMMKHSPIQNILTMSISQKQKQQAVAYGQYDKQVLAINFDKIINSDNQSVIEHQDNSQHLGQIICLQDQKMVQDFQQLFEDVRYLVIQYQKSNHDNQYIQLLNKSLGVKSQDLQRGQQERDQIIA